MTGLLSINPASIPLGKQTGGLLVEEHTYDTLHVVTVGANFELLFSKVLYVTQCSVVPSPVLS